MSEAISKDEVYNIIAGRDSALIKLFTERFDHHDEIDKLTHDRLEEIMKEFTNKLKDQKETITRSHKRLDESDLAYVALATKIKTAQGIWGTFTVALGLVLTYLGVKQG